MNWGRAFKTAWHHAADAARQTAAVLARAIGNAVTDARRDRPDCEARSHRGEGRSEEGRFGNRCSRGKGGLEDCFIHDWSRA